jgi:hypothetical protein
MTMTMWGRVDGGGWVGGGGVGVGVGEMAAGEPPQAVSASRNSAAKAGVVQRIDFEVRGKPIILDRHL